ncbi:hypothetical protein KIPB_010305 [Kipferlia bialata]|uniref:Uncharacterized protein n=1 Tax=Kipferlia bialata TaxID=797122 RepID=A0A9K3D2V9_9EUKA|nr:hypothetical protein KIPB_010305 [Kipferlia bialata]|eukprot:g10305.t1
MQNTEKGDGVAKCKADAQLQVPQGISHTERWLASRCPVMYWAHKHPEEVTALTSTQRRALNRQMQEEKRMVREGRRNICGKMDDPINKI